MEEIFCHRPLYKVEDESGRLSISSVTAEILALFGP